MKTLLFIVFSMGITCISSLAEESVEDLKSMDLPHVLVLKMILFHEAISAEAPEIDISDWPHASVSLNPEQVKFAKNLKIESQIKNVFYKIEDIRKVRINNSDPDMGWNTIYREFDKKTKMATRGFISITWFKNSSSEWNLAGVGASESPPPRQQLQKK